MYTTSSIAPVFLVHALFHSGLLSNGSKVVLVSSESGSITLRHETEGGGNYAHHASKAALNMVGKLLSLDLKNAGVVISIIHPGFMRSDMTKGVGFDKFWDDGGGESNLLPCRSLPIEVVLITQGSCDDRRGGQQSRRVGGPVGHQQDRRVLGSQRTRWVPIHDSKSLPNDLADEHRGHWNGRGDAGEGLAYASEAALVREGMYRAG
jgi:NAD(P)-dependent dehydrogenase (short-subunit alcohol dehydrogenase family)